MKRYNFIKQSNFNVSVEDAFDWHANPGALMRLNPPWEKVVVSEQTGITDGSITDMKVFQGPIGLRWLADHTGYIKNKRFIDIQRQGPFPYWEHSHLFEIIDDHNSKMTDSIKYRLPFSILGDIFANKFIKSKIEKMFRYRHEITKNDLNDLNTYKSSTQNIVISGASGILGEYISSYLKAQGNNVVPLVRKEKDLSNILWNTENGNISSCLACSDVVLHLAGEPIGEGRWTEDKKNMIINSRIEGTRQIAEQIAKIKNPPSTLICASAIGFYGDRGNEILTEDSKQGDDFISEVCSAWEAAAKPAIDRGIRVIFLRIGVVLTPAGGALKKFLLPFKLGMGMHMGTGSQVMSWILPDDVASAINHILVNKEISGAVNLTAPNPVSHKLFAKTLGHILHRPSLFSIPEWVIYKIFGQMGKEILLSSTQAVPKKLLDSGYIFKYPELKDALGHITGVKKSDEL